MSNPTSHIQATARATKAAVSKEARAKSRNQSIAKQAGVPGHIIEAVPDYPLRTDLLPPVLSFVVYGIPAPQGSKSFKGFRGGKSVLKEQSEGVHPWRDSVRAMGVKAIRDWSTRTGTPWVALNEPVLVSAIVTVPQAEAAKARGDIFAEGAPDLDKLQRAIGDAIAPRPLGPDEFKGLPEPMRRKARAEAMAERRKVSILHDDSRIVSWDHVQKVYPNSTPDSLGYPGVTIRVWRMQDLHRLARRPLVLRGGVPCMNAGDLRTWARPLSGLTWDTESQNAWQNPAQVLSAGEEATLQGRGIDQDGIRVVLRALALHGPGHPVPVRLAP